MDLSEALITDLKHVCSVRKDRSIEGWSYRDIRILGPELIVLRRPCKWDCKCLKVIEAYRRALKHASDNDDIEKLKEEVIQMKKEIAHLKELLM